MHFRPLRFVLGVPLPGHGLEGCAGVEDRRGSLFLFGDRRIAAVAQYRLGLVALLPGVGQADLWIGAEGQQVFLVGESVLHPPQLRAGWRDLQVQAAAIGQLAGFVGSLGLANFGIG
ncbi:hypothetical protein D3C78_849650 [compost metagenome]